MPTLKQARRTYWKKRTLQDFGPRDWIKKESNDDLTLYLKTNSYIEVDGSDNKDDHRGDKKDLVVLDEFKDIDPMFYPEVIEPMFVTTGGIVVIIGTPPETPESHFKDLEMFAKRDPSWATFHWTSYDSPYADVAWLNAKKEEMTRRGELDVFKREYLAEYTVGGKNSVFPMVSRALHGKLDDVVRRYFQRIINHCELYWISDPAQSSTFASLFVAYHREKGQILVLDEIYERDRSRTHTKAIVEVAEAKARSLGVPLSKWQIIYDDHEVWFSSELLHGHGYHATPAGKGGVEKEEGIGLMKSLFLTKNSVVISEACECLFTELENYITVNGKYPKVGDHLIDCFRYFLVFARVVLALSGEDKSMEDSEAYYGEILPMSYDESDLPEYMG